MAAQRSTLQRCLPRHGALVLLLVVATTMALAFRQSPAAGPAEPSRIPIIEAGDVAKLREHYGKRIFAMGTVKSAEWSRTGKVMNIEFEGAEGRGLLAVVFENRRKAFDEAWSGDFAKTLTGRRVRLYAEVREYGGYEESFKGRPQVILNSPEQVTLPAEEPQQQ